MTFRHAPLALLLTNLALAQTAEHPIASLPYTPGLDVSSMDRTVDPCSNFYLYACGGWIKTNPIPPDQARWNVYSKLHHDDEMFLWGILEEVAKPDPDGSPERRQIGDYFAACMNEAAVSRVGSAPLKPFLAE